MTRVPRGAADAVEVILNGRIVVARDGESVASALLNAGVWRLRVSPGGDGRAPLCGMGVCYECRVTIDGAAHQRACMTSVRAGLRVVTDGERG